LNENRLTAEVSPAWSWALVKIAALTFPVVLLLAPNVEEGRTEARYRQARADCVRLTEELQGRSPQEWGTLSPERVVTLDKNDPFGQPYLAQIDPNSSLLVRVFSRGPDGESNSAGLDPDDMSLDLPWTQLDQIRQRRRIEWWTAFGSWAGLCCLGVFLVRKNTASQVL